MVRYFSLMLFIRKSTLIYNSLLVTRLTQHFFFFAKRNAGCQCCFLLKVSVNLAYFYVLISQLQLIEKGQQIQTEKTRQSIILVDLRQLPISISVILFRFICTIYSKFSALRVSSVFIFSKASFDALSSSSITFYLNLDLSWC